MSILRKERKKMINKQNFVGMSLEVYFKLTVEKRLELIKWKKPEVNRYKNKPDNINIYFRICGRENLVYMHISSGYGIVISEFIKNKKGEIINLVEELSQYYWFIDNHNNIVKTTRLNYRTIWRCIGSLMEYGDIVKKLPTQLQVHHKYLHYCNTVESLKVVTYEKHQYFHNHIGTKRSRKYGRIIRNVHDFDIWINDLEKINEKLKMKDM